MEVSLSLASQETRQGTLAANRLNDSTVPNIGPRYSRPTGTISVVSLLLLEDEKNLLDTRVVNG